MAKVVANPEVRGNLPLPGSQIVATTKKRWRLEKNSDGYYRWRWQLKDDNGKSITYITKKGNTAYKRGSLYVGKK